MGKNPWEEDSDLRAFSRGGRSPTRWGRVFAGVGLVAVATFVGAYYLPLFRAHDRLSAEQRRAVEQLQSLQKSLTTSQSELRAAVARRDELEAAEKQRESAASAKTSDAEAARSALAAKLDKLIKKNLVQVAVVEGRVVVGVADVAVFAARKLDPSPLGKQTLCEIAKAAAKNPVSVRAIDDGAKSDPALAAKYPNDWSRRAARAAGAADTLVSKCGHSAALVSVDVRDDARSGLPTSKVPPTQLLFSLGRSAGTN
jgi:chemotaxis protein MotB